MCEFSQQNGKTLDCYVGGPIQFPATQFFCSFHYFRIRPRFTESKRGFTELIIHHSFMNYFIHCVPQPLRPLVVCARGQKTQTKKHIGKILTEPYSLGRIRFQRFA